jgi:hypothetical protein
MGGMVNTDYRVYAEQAEITLFGRRLAVLDLTREISPDIPVYPGHMKVAMWGPPHARRVPAAARRHAVPRLRRQGDLHV